MIVADTSPLNYLILIGEIDLLPRLYQLVAIPQAVMNELRHPLAPAAVASFAENPPTWLETVKIEPVEASLSGTMAHLDMGEIAAISLAAAHPGALLLMDETAGRAEAARRGIRSTGTLGILRDAATSGFVDLRSAFEKLEAASFRMPAGVTATC